MCQLSEVYWRCRRGMLELDLFLIPYLEQQFSLLSESDKAIFIALLDKPDPDLLNLLMGYATPDAVERDVVQKIRIFKHKGRLP